MHLLHKMVPETAVLISTDLVFGLHYWDFRSAYSSVTQQVSPTTHFYLMTSGCCLCDRGPKISYQTLGSSETRNCVCVCVCGNAAVQVNPKFLPKGYSRDISFLVTVVDIIKELKKANPSLVYGECQIGFSILKSELFFKPHF